MAAAVSPLVIEDKAVLPGYIYKGATLNISNYLKLLKMAGIKDTYEVGMIKDCVERLYYSKIICEDGHKPVVYHCCSDEVFCPRCNERNALERMDKIIAKFEYFQCGYIGKFVFTVPEDKRELVFADKKKFKKVVNDTLNVFYGGTVGGVSISHDYSSEKPWVLNPHVEVYVSDLVLKSRKYLDVRKTVCRTNKKTHKVEVFNPDKHITAKEWFDNYKKHKVRTVPRRMTGDFKRLDNMFLPEDELERLKNFYSKTFCAAFGDGFVKLNVNYSYYQVNDSLSMDKLRYHSIPYSLKMPLSPEGVVDMSDDGVISYHTRRDGMDNLFVDTVENVKKVFSLDYYNKSKQKRLSWFGFMSDSVWRDYVFLLRGVFPELSVKKSVDDFRFCSVCGKSVVSVKSNSMVYAERCVEHDIKFEFMDRCGVLS